MKTVEGYAIMANSKVYPKQWVIKVILTDGFVEQKNKRKLLKSCKQRAFIDLKEEKKMDWALKNWKIKKIRLIIGKEVALKSKTIKLMSK